MVSQANVGAKTSVKALLMGGAALTVMSLIGVRMVQGQSVPPESGLSQIFFFSPVAATDGVKTPTT